MTAKPQIDPVDAHVGRRLRIRRRLLKLSQLDVATAIGVSFQQVQKYERGANHISVSRLYDLARALKVDITYFFDDIDADEDEVARVDALPVGDPLAAPDTRTESLELLSDYWRLPDKAHRETFRDLLRVSSRTARVSGHDSEQ